MSFYELGKPHGLISTAHWSITVNSKNQGFGSGSVPDPDSIRAVDPDSYSEAGSESRRAKMIYKSRKN
jgi:hypothetical protein